MDQKIESESSQNFLWGVTHIGAQTESVCASSDWAQACATDRMPAIGRGLEYLQRYASHHQAAQELGVGAFRLTIEWARVEPREGEFDTVALAHYREILEDLRARNIQTVVGLFHYVSPAWFSESYGWHHPHARVAFPRFAQEVMDALGDLIDVVVIHNEPMLYISLGYVRGSRPPFIKNIFQAARVCRNIIFTQKMVYKKWKVRYPQTLLGSAHLWNAIVSEDKGLVTAWAGSLCAWISYVYRAGFMVMCTKNASDYTGVNYYTKNNFYLGKNRKNGKWGRVLHETNDWHDPDVWKHFSKGLEISLRQAHRFGKPIMILENGKPSVPGVHDDDRQEFLRAHTDVIVGLRDEYAIIGYFHHSLMDCYEWDSGYNFLFGLIEVDRQTLEQTKRKSYDVYKAIIEQSTQS